MSSYDYIIVGGGSAGSVLANRLSARSENRVLLCEAGPDMPDGKIPREILDSYPGTAFFNSNFLWPDLMVTHRMRSHNNAPGPVPKAQRYEQARILGGGSSINGQLYNRGAPSDYDEWATKGARGWDWQGVLPFFKKIENDQDFDGPLHGKSGRIPVRRIFPEQWPGHTKAIAAALREKGYAYLPDQNGEFAEGYFPITMSNLNEQRVSASMGYLDAETRRRPNLTIRTGAVVSGLRFEGKRCVGITLQGPGGSDEISGHEVILSAGAVQSPAILLRAGIGPAGHLRQMGIEPLHALAGVGQNLMEHPSIALASFLRKQSRVNSFTRRHILLGWRYSSGIAGAPVGDMWVAAVSKTAWHTVGDCIGTLLMYVAKPYSDHGAITLTSKDWRVNPQVDLNLLSDPRDLDRLVDGFRRMAAVQLSAAMSAATADPFPASYSEKVRQVGIVSRKNKILTDILSRLLDGPAILRSMLIKQVVSGGPTLQELLASDDALRDFVRGAAVGVWHPSCSCRMGSADDPMAVTDPEGRVHGIQGLRVADASIFPTVPSANLNFPVMMAAEKVADAILG